MTCHRCGLCCNTQTTEIPDNCIRQVSFRKNFIKVVKDKEKTYAIFKSECKHFKDNRCMIYDRRPEACKIFPLEENKERWRKVNPGCGML
jgi:Fe-S-cluster containining protein